MGFSLVQCGRGLIVSRRWGYSGPQQFAVNKGTTAGEVSFRYLLRALADGGRSDLIYATHNTDTQGYGLQVKLGKTSLTEAWNGGSSSQNHFMYGQINEWFFHDLAGIQPDPAAPGFRKIIIKPAIVGDLTWVKATYGSACGDITSDWTNGPSGLTMSLTVPATCAATVHVPAANPDGVKEGPLPASSAPGVVFLRAENGAAVYAVNCGSYFFSSTTATAAAPSRLTARVPAARSRWHGCLPPTPPAIQSSVRPLRTPVMLRSRGT